MSKRKRRHLSAEFKARVASEALKGLKTIQQIAQENELAPAQVSAWKKELEERAAELFERANARDKKAEGAERRTGQLERKVGQLVIEPKRSGDGQERTRRARRVA